MTDDQSDTAALGDAPLQPRPAMARRTRWLIPVLLSAVILVLGGVVWWASSPHSRVHIVLPSTLLGLRRNTSQDAKQLAYQFAGTNQKQGPKTIAVPLAAEYGNTATGRALLLFVRRWCAGGGCRPVSEQRALQTEKADRYSDATAFPLGRPGSGWMTCFSHRYQNDPVISCTWFDHITLGSVIFSRGYASNLADAASKTRQIRQAVER